MIFLPFQYVGMDQEIRFRQGFLKHCPDFFQSWLNHCILCGNILIDILRLYTVVVLVLSSELS